MRVWMSLRGRVGAWARAFACMHVALLIQHASRMLHNFTSFVVPQSSPLSHKRIIFEKRLFNIKCVFLFPLQLLSKTFLHLRII